MRLCSKCGRAQIKVGTCFEPCQRVEDFLRDENTKLRSRVIKLRSQVATLAEALRKVANEQLCECDGGFDCRTDEAKAALKAAGVEP